MWLLDAVFRPLVFTRRGGQVLVNREYFTASLAGAIVAPCDFGDDGFEAVDIDIGHDLWRGVAKAPGDRAVGFLVHS